jgi:predicted transcriptional regulator
LNIKGRKNRRTTDIVADILKATINGDTKTHIMYKANLSFPLLKKYLKVLIDKGLIIQDIFEYRISRLGRDFLELYEETNHTRSILQKREEELERVFPLINEDLKPRLK